MVNKSLFSVIFCRQVFIVAILFSLSGCIAKSKIDITLKNTKKTEALNVTVSNIQVINHQVVITGTNLNSVSNFQIKEGSNNATLAIESQTSTSIVANALSDVTFAAGKMFDFILSNASASTTFSINFSLCDSTLGKVGFEKGFNCDVEPNDKEVLSYSASTGKWEPRAVNGLSYIGTFDASSGVNPPIKAAGQYYIVSVAGDIDSGATVLGVGDWIVSSGAVWQKIDNSTVINSVHGRTGLIVGAEGDYSLNLLSDVTLTTPTNNQILKYNGTNWVNTDLSALGGGTVTNVTGSAPVVVSNGGSTPAISITQATTSTNGYLSSADWNTFNNKQGSIAAGTTSQYYRGDKSWQTLDSSVVPENTNLYFTNARALGVPLTGFSAATNTSIIATDTILSALGKAQGQINNLTTGGSNYLIKNGTDTITGVVNVNTIGALSIGYTPTNLTDATSKSYVDTQRDSRVAKAGDTLTGDLQLNTKLKFKDSGSNTVTLQAPTTVTASYVLKLPGAVGSANQVLTTDASGNLSWTTPSATGAPIGAAGGDLGGTYPNPSVAQVNGVTAANISAGATLANNATNANTASTIVKRDASGNFTAGTITATLSGNATNVTGIVAIANGGTGASTASGARTNLGLGTAAAINTGAAAGNIPLLGTGGVSGSNVCTGDGAGAIICSTPLPSGDALTTNPLSQFANTTSAQLRGVLSDETGSGVAVFATAPTISNPIITNIAPGADFSITQNSVVPFTSVNAGAVVNTLYLKAGKVGVGTTSPAAALDVNGAIRVGTDATACSAANAGAMRFNVSNVEYCNGSAWTAFGISNASGTVTSVIAGTGLTGGTITASGTIAVDVGTTANKILQLNGSAQIPAVDGSLLTNLNPANLSGAVGVSKGGTGATTLTANQLLLGNGSSALSSLGAGTSGQILSSTGATAPAWITTLPIANGGTGATTAILARANLGIGSAGTGATGSTTGAIPLVGTGGIIANNFCAGDVSGGGVSCSVANSSAGLAGLISDETGTGVLVFGTSPIFTTNITTPLIVGGATTTSSLIYKTTTGVGASGADHIFQVGNNGATEAMRILNSGFVGIGIAAPTTNLDVVGSIKSSGQISSGSQTITGGTTAINWNNGNAISTDYNCASDLAFANLKDGGTYTLVATDTGTTQCGFSTTTTGIGAGTVSYRFKPANAARTASSHTIYTLMRVGSVVYVSWASGF